MALTERAYKLHAEQRDVEAINCLKSALAIEPTLIPALYLKGIIALTHRQYDAGFTLFDLRNARHGVCQSALKYREWPQWDGKRTVDRVVIWAEDWLGDAVQMLRYLPAVKQLCPDFILDVPAPLHRLCAGIPLAEATERPTLQCSLLSLPRLFGVVAGRGSYLRVPEALVKPWAAVLGDLPRIGFCWKGNPANTYRDAVRSIHDESAIKSFGERVNVVSLHRDLTCFKDVADLAGLIANLDLVISVDTLQAHLAGALGKPVWILLSVDCDWRWGQRSESTPWYSTARLFRQKTPGDWAGILDDVLEALNARAPALA